MTGKRIMISVILLFLLFATCFGGYIEQELQSGVDGDAATMNSFVSALSTVCISIVAMMFIPFVVKLINRKKLSHKVGNILCIVNSIMMFIVPALFDVPLIGGVGAIGFYFINKWMFVEDKNKKEYEPILEEEEQSENIIQKEGECKQSVTSQPKYICLSPEDEKNTYSSEIGLVKENIVVHINKSNAGVVSSKKNKERYCFRCGSLIDPDSKKCTGCAKQYFKGFSINTIFIMVLSVCLLGSALVNVILYDKNADLQMQNEEYMQLNESYSAQNKEYRQYREYYFNVQDKISFFDEYVVFVEDDGTNLYHKYECDRFKQEGFWIYGEKAAKVDGYVSCPICCD